MKSIKLEICLLSSLLLASCTPTIPKGGLSGYEILPQPKATSFYPVGSGWIKGVGPNGQGTAEVVSEGVESLDQKSSGKVTADVDAEVNKVLTASLNLSTGSLSNVHVEDLRHRRVDNISDSANKGLILWETIEGSRISFKTNKNHSVGANADLENEAIKNVGDAKLKFNKIGDSEYVATSERPLVFAIKVVNLEFSQESENVSISDTPGSSKFGYEITRTEPEDVTNRTVNVFITNPTLSKWAGEKTTLSTDKVWVKADKTGNNGRFTWDTIRLNWNPNRTAVINRQTSIVTSAKSK